jgi:hypothetical protein
MGGGPGNRGNRSPVQNMFLEVMGAPQPEQAPEVYYLFTARTQDRQGGEALGSSFHQAKVSQENGVWKAEVRVPAGGTVEMFSRFRLGDRTVYSQTNYQHSLYGPAAEGLPAVPEVAWPKDWPRFVFPASSYNDMPFQGIQTGASVSFEVKKEEKPVTPEEALFLEAQVPGKVVDLISFKKGTYTLAAGDDPDLPAVSTRRGGGGGGGGGRGGGKLMLALVSVPESGEVMTFSLNLSRSRWSLENFLWGLGYICVAGLVIALIVIRQRKRFKYNDHE